MALAFLQEVGVHVIAPLAALVKDPLPNAVAVVSLRDYAAKGVTLPEGAARFAITVDGTESEAEVEALKVCNYTLFCEDKVFCWSNFLISSCPYIALPLKHVYVGTTLRSPPPFFKKKKVGRSKPHTKENRSQAGLVSHSSRKDLLHELISYWRPSPGGQVPWMLSPLLRTNLLLLLLNC